MRMPPVLCFFLAAAAPPVHALSLNEALQLAQRGNFDVLSARAAERVSQAEVERASARPNPTVSINSTNINPHAGTGSGNLWQRRADTVIRFEQTIELGGKRALRVSAARAGLDAAQAETAATVSRQNLAVAAAYVNLRAAQEKLALATAGEQAYRDTLAYAELRLSRGDIAEVDALRVRADAARAANELTLARNERDAARSSLALLLGRGDGANDLAADDPWPPLDGPPEAADPAPGAASERPQVLAARAAGGGSARQGCGAGTAYARCNGRRAV